MITYRPETIPFDPEKFAELVLYVSDRCSTDPDFGATKLNKILYYCDFLAYGNLGQPITGADYFKLPQGPAPRQLLRVRSAMIEAGDLAIHPKQVYNRVQERPVPRRQPNVDLFTAKEIALVDQVIEALHGKNATEVSELSHLESLGWRLADERESIPYATVFVSADPPTADDIERGRELAEAHGWR